MKHGSLFSGIGGFDLAAEWMGWQNAFHCEYNPFCQRVLKHYWPNATTYTDIRETDFTFWRGKIDILTGGFPCQPYSTAGKRRGKDDERHLWPEMLRAIREVAPRWIVGENVRGIISWNAGLVFEEVQADLEAAGYEVQPFVLPAASVGAPHKRERVWFIAYSGKYGDDCRTSQGSNLGRKQPKDKKQKRNGWTSEITRLGQLRPPAHPHHPGSSTPGRGADPHRPAQGEEREREPQRRAGGPGSVWDVTHSGRFGLEGRVDNGQDTGKAATQPGRQAAGRGEPENWQHFPTQPPVLPGDDGLSAPVAGYTARQWYNEHIKVAGNAIVPQVALQIFKAIEAYEKR